MTGKKVNKTVPDFDEQTVHWARQTQKQIIPDSVMQLFIPYRNKIGVLGRLKMYRNEGQMQEKAVRKWSPGKVKKWVLSSEMTPDTQMEERR